MTDGSREKKCRAQLNSQIYPHLRHPKRSMKKIYLTPKKLINSGKMTSPFNYTESKIYKLKTFTGSNYVEVRRGS